MEENHDQIDRNHRSPRIPIIHLLQNAPSIRDGSRMIDQRLFPANDVGLPEWEIHQPTSGWWFQPL